MSHKVPFFDLKMVPETIKNQWKNDFERVILSGQFIGGDELKNFEAAWAEKIGVSYSAGVGNGLDGLVLALKALGIKSGHRVAVPAHTFIATWNAVHLAGGTPIGVDVDHRGLIDLDLLEQIPEVPQFVIPVHMHGMSVDMQRLMKWARANDCLVIEDASQAHLAKSGGKMVGSTSDVGVFSLYPSKNLGALGDGGVITTNSKEVFSRIRSLQNYGAAYADKYNHTTLGVNSRLDSIQAALLTTNVGHLEDWNSKRKIIAGFYLGGLATHEQLHFLNTQLDDSVWHHFPILVKNRSELIRYLDELGIGTEIHYPKLASHEFAKIMGTAPVPFGSAELISGEILSMPISPWHTKDQIEYVINSVNSFFGV
jgi:dTDP-4-amino-4,6-dideoxygalactose transaminase